MKKIIMLLLLLACAFGLSACKKEENFVACIGSDPATIDPALNSSVDGATYIIHAFSGLIGYDKDGKLVADCAKAIPTGTLGEDGKTTYVFELKDDLKWNDGTPLTAEDFKYAWDRAYAPETAADYQYMFDVIDGYNDGQLNVKAEGNKLTVVLTVDVPYFMELCAFPTYMPVKKSIVEADPEGWATKVDTYVGNGPYKLTEFTLGSKLVFEKNPYYHNANAVTLERLEFALSADDNAILAGYKNNTYKFIDTVPNDEIKTLQEEYDKEFFIEGQLGTYYVSFNINRADFAKFTQEENVKIRKALSLFIDRKYVCEVYGQAGQQPAAGFVASGLKEPDGKEYVSKNGPEGNGAGYYDVADGSYESNCAKGIALLKEVIANHSDITFDEATKKFSGFPTLEYITNEGTGHEAIATYLKQVWANYGFNTEIGVSDWNTFLETRKNGEYSVARNGWLGDYNDPISFLDMWTTISGNNDTQFGRDAHADYAGYSYDGKTGLTWAESYDAIIAQVKASKDPVERFALMHKAENILMETGCICPIYYYTDIFMCKDDVEGFFASPLGYKYFMYIK